MRNGSWALPFCVKTNTDIKNRFQPKNHVLFQLKTLNAKLRCIKLTTNHLEGRFQVLVSRPHLSPSSTMPWLADT